MIHNMKLQNSCFQMIKEKLKTIEMRLNDEKRANIKVGDTIIFTNIDDGEQLKCLVINLYRYHNFEELYDNHHKTSLGYLENETANPSDMLKYYSKEKIEKYGVIGIEVAPI